MRSQLRWIQSEQWISSVWNDDADALANQFIYLLNEKREKEHFWCLVIISYLYRCLHFEFNTRSTWFTCHCNWVHLIQSISFSNGSFRLNMKITAVCVCVYEKWEYCINVDSEISKETGAVTSVYFNLSVFNAVLCVVRWW